MEEERLAGPSAVHPAGPAVVKVSSCKHTNHFSFQVTLIRTRQYFLFLLTGRVIHCACLNHKYWVIHKYVVVYIYIFFLNIWFTIMQMICMQIHKHAKARTHQQYKGINFLLVIW